MALAQASTKRINEIAYSELVCENPWLDTRLQFLRDEDASHSVSTRRPFILLIVNNQETITFWWPDGLVLYFYPTLRCTLADVGIPIAWGKSSPPDLVTQHTMQFIRHVINIGDKTIRPSPDKWAKIGAATLGMSVGGTYSFEKP